MHQTNQILHAIAKIYGSSAFPELHGTVSFRQTCSGVIVTAELFDLPHNDMTENNIFAFHIHDGIQCSGNADDAFADAGSHFNPDVQEHPYHAGDLPPLFGNHGYAYMSVFTDRFTVEEVIDRVVIVHREQDDFTTQPSGNAGAKIACGKICAK